MNALNVPGGPVWVTRGLLQITDDEAQWTPTTRMSPAPPALTLTVQVWQSIC